MSYQLICSDAKDFIRASDQFESVITSLPDSKETGMSINEWKLWFFETVCSIIEKTNEYAVFYHTDRKKDGCIVSKSYLVQKAIESTNASLVFHKIVLRKDINSVDMYRPTFTHLQCVSKNLKCGSKLFPDVILAGNMLYPNAMGSNAVQMACDFIQTNGKKTKTIVDPFCGQGSVLIDAQAYGFNAIGNDIDPKQIEKAQSHLDKTKYRLDNFFVS